MNTKDTRQGRLRKTRCPNLRNLLPCKFCVSPRFTSRTLILYLSIVCVLFIITEVQVQGMDAQFVVSSGAVMLMQDNGKESSGRQL